MEKFWVREVEIFLNKPLEFVQIFPSSGNIEPEA